MFTDEVLDALLYALELLQQAKPEERNELARRYAITITEMEKVIAYYNTYISNA